MKKEQNRRESLRRLKFILGCNASKRMKMKLMNATLRHLAKYTSEYNTLGTSGLEERNSNFVAKIIFSPKCDGL